MLRSTIRGHYVVREEVAEGTEIRVWDIIIYASSASLRRLSVVSIVNPIRPPIGLSILVNPHPATSPNQP